MPETAPAQTTDADRPGQPRRLLVEVSARASNGPAITHEAAIDVWALVKTPGGWAEGLERVLGRLSGSVIRGLAPNMGTEPGDVPCVMAAVLHCPCTGLVDQVVELTIPGLRPDSLVAIATSPPACRSHAPDLLAAITHRWPSARLRPVGAVAR